MATDFAQNVVGWQFENTYSQLPDVLHVPAQPSNFQAPVSCRKIVSASLKTRNRTWTEGSSAQICGSPPPRPREEAGEEKVIAAVSGEAARSLFDLLTLLSVEKRRNSSVHSRPVTSSFVL